MKNIFIFFNLKMFLKIKVVIILILSIYKEHLTKQY